MAISKDTLGIARRYRQDLRKLSDDQVLAMTRSWVSAWDELEPDLNRVYSEVAESHSSRGSTSGGLSRDDRLRAAGNQVHGRMEELVDQAGAGVAEVLPEVATGTAANQLQQWQSQLPSGWESPGGALGAFNVTTEDALDSIASRSAGRLTSRLNPLPDEQEELMKRGLFRGISEGANPNKVARRMMRDTRGAFDGGLARAATISRTEMLDAHRDTAVLQRNQNEAVQGWVWTATFDGLVCLSCLDMHGTEFPKEQFGPEDHPNGRCVAVDKLQSWKSMGIDLPEEPEYREDARGWFEGLTEETQANMMGPTRFQKWQNGEVNWGRFSERRENEDWRPYYIQRPVKDL